MVALDIGANIGAMTLHMARLVGTTGKVLAFEPAPPILKRLQENITRNNFNDRVTIFNVALGDTEGTLELAYADINTENQGMASLYNKNNVVVTLSCTVQAKCLNTMGLDLSRCDLIKVDIQGAETNFLKGAALFIKKFKPKILIEVSAIELKSNNSTPRELCEYIENLDYNLQTLSGIPISACMLPSDFEASSVLCIPNFL